MSLLPIDMKLAPEPVPKTDHEIIDEKIDSMVLDGMKPADIVDKETAIKNYTQLHIVVEDWDYLIQKHQEKLDERPFIDELVRGDKLVKMDINEVGTFLIDMDLAKSRYKELDIDVIDWRYLIDQHYYKLWKVTHPIQ